MKKSTMGSEVMRVSAGLFAGALIGAAGCIPAFATEADPQPDPLPSVTQEPQPQPQPDPEPDPVEPPPAPKPSVKPDSPRPDKTPNTGNGKPSAATNKTGSKTTGKTRAVSSKAKTLKPRGSFTTHKQARNLETQELAKTGALATTGGLCALALIVGGGGTLLVRKLRTKSVKTVTGRVQPMGTAVSVHSLKVPENE